MIYYIFLAVIDIGLFLKSNWKELSFTAVASGIGVIVGRRIGTRLAFHYALRIMGIRHKPTLERKVEWLIQQEEARGNPWNAESSTLKPNMAKTLYIQLQKGTFHALSTIASIPQWGIKKLTLRRKLSMKEYLRKLGSRKFQALLTSLIINIACAALFLTQTVDIDGVINQWMPIINMSVATISTWVYILVEGGIDKAQATKPALLVGGTNAPYLDDSEFVESPPAN